MRKSGILLHISSLPSKYGIGSLGVEAYEFIDFLKESNVKCWQILPIGPTSYGDSPYQSLGANAYNPYFIDLEDLVDLNLLKKSDLKVVRNSEVDYKYLYETRFKILKKAFNNFNIKSENFANFCFKNKSWLDDFSLFMALKKHHLDKSFLEWEDKYKYRDQDSLSEYIENNLDEVNFWKFTQFMFYNQWMKLKSYANSMDIEIIGDMPIYVSLDSSDVWANKDNFLLDEFYNPKVVAGVPPDYFSQNGQLWGNPIYNFEHMKNNNYQFWVDRVENAFKLFDYLRIDHFRGFASYYVIDSFEKTAVNGRWVKGPGVSLFNAIKDKLGDKKIIAEDLGILSEDVYELLESVKFPGMKVLQFAFDLNSNSIHLPHNYDKNSVCYTGTHDNTTLKDWVNSLSLEQLKFVCSYVGVSEKTTSKIIDGIIRQALRSVSDLCVIPLVDYLKLDGSARFNNPSVAFGNWKFMIKKSSLNHKLASYIKNLNHTYRR